MEVAAIVVATRKKAVNCSLVPPLGGLGVAVSTLGVPGAEVLIQAGAKVHHLLPRLQNPLSWNAAGDSLH